VALVGSSIGALLPDSVVLALVLITGACIVFSLLWHLRGSLSFPGNRVSMQVDRERTFYTPTGRFYFGAVMGVGLLTHMTTPLVYVFVLLTPSMSYVQALVIASGFATGRSIPILAGFMNVLKRPDPGDVSVWIVTPRVADRFLGVVVSAASGLLLLMAL